MKTFNTPAPYILLLLTLIFACKKDKVEPKTPSNILCEGKAGLNSYFPLSVGNTWVYETPSGKRETLKISGYETINGSVYIKADYIKNGDYTLRFFRYDQYGNIHEYIDWIGADVMFLPYSCVKGQELGFGSSITEKKIIHRSVTSLSAHCSSNSCFYENCIMVEYSYTIGGPVIGRSYFKKGLGLVYESFNSTSGGENAYKLITVDIK